MSRIERSGRPWLVLGCAVGVAVVGLDQGCAGAGDDDTGDAGRHAVALQALSSGAICPNGSTLTYATFGQSFVAEYCLTCHTEQVQGAARRAPVDRNFDDVYTIQSLAFLIDQQAGAGPTVVHEVMPPVEPRPTLDERKLLGEWLACGAPP